MIEIDDPPNWTNCICAAPITWVWHHRKKTWYPAGRYDAHDPLTFRIHDCGGGTPPQSWRHVKAQPPEVHVAGVRRARAVLAAKAKTSTDKGAP